MEEAGGGVFLGKDLRAFHRPLQFGRNYICQFVGRIHSRGVWFGDDPLSYSLPLFLLQLSLVSLIIRSLYLLLKPLGQPLIISQILGGLILGPSVFGRNSAFAARVFPVKGRVVVETLSLFGFMLFIFLIGVKIDPAMVVKSGRKALVIGVLCFFVPYALTALAAFLLSHLLSLDPYFVALLPLIAALLSSTSFPVVSCFLAELNILNSEVGRLASSSSLICDVCRGFVLSLRLAAKIAKMKSVKSLIGSFLSGLSLVLLIVFGIRRAALWTIRHTPEGKPVKDLYVILLIVLLMGCGFMGEAIGMSSVIAAFLVGLVIPDGPPLAAALVERLDCFVSDLLMPIFFAMCGSNMDVFSIRNLKTLAVILLVVLVAFLGKTMTAILPPLFLRMPLRDAFSFALVLNSKGIVELAVLTDLKRAKEMNQEIFSIMIVSLVIVTGLISPLVKVLYDPSRGYLAYRRRTFFHSKANEELRILACIHREDNVQAVVNLLDASHPTRQRPVNLVVLHLVKLVGRASSLLGAHRPREKPSPYPSQSERIFNAFRKFEQRSRGALTINCFKGISPYATMHNDVCCIALERRTTFIVLPFHKHWSFGEWVESPVAIRNMNRNVLNKSPCSVGILVDRGSRRKFRAVVAGAPVYRVAVLFFGGLDDREALAYARRMSENPSVSLTLLCFSSSTDIVGGTERSKVLDSEILSEFRGKAEECDRISCHEAVVVDGTGVMEVSRSVESVHDLVMVGRRHGESEFMGELRRWDGCEELGRIGGMLAASELEDGASILVVQQQTRVWGMHDPEDSTHLRRVAL